MFFVRRGEDCRAYCCIPNGFNEALTENRPQSKRQMALAYGTYGCKSYHSPELLKDIVYALDWMEANMYGAEVLSDTSFRSYKVFNWWDWYIGGAVSMLETVMIIEESLTREEIDRYVLPMSFLRTQMRLGNNAEMAVGQILPCTPLALLTNDKALLQSMYLALTSTAAYSP